MQFKRSRLQVAFYLEHHPQLKTPEENEAVCEGAQLQTM